MAIIEKMLNLNKSAVDKSETVLNMIKKEKFRDGQYAKTLVSGTPVRITFTALAYLLRIYI
jgi:hypothetical protein